MAAEIDNSTSRFELDGVEYDVPDFLDLELGDWEVVYDESKVVLSDFAPDPDEEANAQRLERLKNPRVEKAFLMVAYLRAHPEATVDEAREMCAKAKLVPLLEKLNPVDEGDAADPTSTTELERSSLRSEDDSNESSSLASLQSSETRDDEPAPTGTGG